MPLAAQLIESLHLTGSRKTDGSVNAGGLIYLYDPGTTTAVTGYYQDSSGVLAAYSAGAITLDSAGKADIYVDQDVDLVITTSAAAAVSTTYLAMSKVAETLVVTNSGFNGTLASGATGAGGRASLDAILSLLYATVGGTDARYLESAGATARTIVARLGEHIVSVKDFGAVGDGATDDTVAVQATINRVIARGGGEVFFPKGTYLISAALTVTPASTTISVILRGSGLWTTTIKSNHASANCITVTIANGLRIENMNLLHSSTGSGIGISIVGCDGVVLSNVNVPSLWSVGVAIGESGINQSQNVYIRDCSIGTRATVAGDCALRIGQGAANTTRHISVDSCYLAGGTGATIPTIAIAGLTTDIKFTKCRIAGATNGFVLVDDGTTFTTWSGVGIAFLGNHFNNVAAAVIYLLRPTVVGQFQSFGNTFDANPTYTNTAMSSVIIADAAFTQLPLGQYLNPSLNTATIAGVTNFTPRLEYGNVCKVTLNNVASNCEIQTPTNVFTTREGTLVFLTVIKTATVAGFSFIAAIVNNTGVAPSTTTGQTYTAVLQYTNAKWMIIAATQGAS